MRVHINRFHLFISLLLAGIAGEGIAQTDTSLTYGIIKIRSEEKPKTSIFKEVSIGFKSGPSKIYFKGLHSLADMYVEDINNHYLDTQFPGSFGITNSESTPRYFYYPSLYFNFTNHKVFSLQVELNYLKKMFENDIYISGTMLNQAFTEENFLYNFNEQIHLKYLEIPFLFKIKAYKIKAEPYFSMGLAPIFLLKSDRITNVNYLEGSQEITDTLRKYNSHVENSKNITSNKIGIHIVSAFGNHLYVSKKFKLNVEARYNYNLLENARIDFKKLREQVNSRSLTFTIGLQYNLNFDNTKVPKLDRGIIKKKKEHFEKIYQNTFYLNHLSVQSGYSTITAQTKKISGEDLITPDQGYSANVALNYFKTINPYLGFETGLSFGSKEYYYGDWKMEKEAKGMIYPFGTLKAGFFYHYNVHKKIKFFVSAGANASTYFESQLNFRDIYLHKTVANSNPYDAIVIENNYSRFGISAYQKAGIIYKLKNYHVIHLNLISNVNLQRFRVGDYTSYSLTGESGEGILYGENFSWGIEAGFSLLNFLRFAK